MKIGPPRLLPGAVVGRWTVVRLATPRLRGHGLRGGIGRMIWTRRVLVRCVCGAMRITDERYVIKGESLGCSKKTCQFAKGSRCES